MKMRFYKKDVLNKLRTGTKENWKRYRDEETNDWLKSDFSFAESAAEIPEFDGNCDFLKSGGPEADCENSIALFDRFKKLTPRQASMETFWCCLCHSVPEFYVYARERWLSKNPEKIKESTVSAHFFGQIEGDLRTDNALARLWWGAFVSYDRNAENEEDRFALTRVLWKNNTRFTDFMDTFNSRSRSRARGVLRALAVCDEKYPTNTADDFRALNTALNWLSVADPLDFWEEGEIYRYALNFFEERKKRSGNA